MYLSPIRHLVGVWTASASKGTARHRRSMMRPAHARWPGPTGVAPTFSPRCGRGPGGGVEVARGLGCPRQLKARSLRRRWRMPKAPSCRTAPAHFAVHHCGARIQNTHRNLAAQKTDWARLRRFLPLVARASVHVETSADRAPRQRCTSPGTTSTRPLSTPRNRRGAISAGLTVARDLGVATASG